MPRNIEGAQDLWTRDKYHFQKWAVESVDGFVTSKRTADGGIDGRIYFDMPSERDLQSAGPRGTVSLTGSALHPRQARNL